MEFSCNMKIIANRRLKLVEVVKKKKISYVKNFNGNRFDGRFPGLDFISTYS